MNAIARVLEGTAFGAHAADDASPGSLLHGVTPLAAANDREAILAIIDGHQGDPDFSVFVMSPPSLARLQLLHGHQDASSVAGFPIARSAAIGSQIALIDGSGIAWNAAGALPEKLEHISLQMETAPDSPVAASTTMLGLWQHGSIGLGTTQWFGWKVSRPGAVTVAELGNSPG